MNDGEKKVLGILAEFNGPGQLLRAAKNVREAGYKKWDCHSPFAIHGLSEAMGLRKSLVGWFAAIGGLKGCLIAYVMMWWMMSVDYPLVISGKPFNSIPAWIPIMFELTILLTAFFTVGSMFALNMLPRYNHMVFESANFVKKSGDDGFFISIEARDPDFELARAEALLESIGGTQIEVLYDS